MGAYQFTANSQPLVVNTTTDGNSVLPGQLSLRDATHIVDANLDTSTPEPIAFDSTVFASPQIISLSSGLTLGGAAAVAPISIAGPSVGVTIGGSGSAGNEFSVFTVTAGTLASPTEVSLAGLTISNGYAAQGGGILNYGDLTVSNSTFVNNYASDRGGAIFNAAHAVAAVNSSTFSGNIAVEGGGAIYSTAGKMAISTSAFLNNSSPNGSGGAIDNTNSGVLNITNDTFDGNTAGLSGVHANDYGGGVNNSAATLTATDNTFYNNSADLGGGIYTTGTSLLNGDILVGNNSYQTGTVDDINGSKGPSHSSSYNLVDVDNTNVLAIFGIGNQVGVTAAAANLAPLGWYGGPTETIALIPGSPAIAAGMTDGPSTDQRGQARPSAQTDIGAYQTTPTLDVNTNVASNQVPIGIMSLQDAVNVVNVDTTTLDTVTEPITFAASEFITLVLNSLVLGPTIPGTTIAPVQINQPGASVTISGNNLYTDFTIDSGVTATFNDLVIECGDGVNGGGINNAGTLTITGSSISDDLAITNGGGIYSTGNLTVSGSNFTEDSAQCGDGGAIYATDSTLTITDTSFNSNTAYSGLGGALYTTGQTSITNDTGDSYYITSNSASVGGGIYNTGTLSISSMSISFNSAPQSDGGAIYNSGTLSINGDTLNNNNAFNGGGIFNASTGMLTTHNSTYFQNDGDFNRGGGGAIWNSGKMTATDITMTGNQAWTGGGLYTSGSTLLNGDLLDGNLSGMDGMDDVDGSGMISLTSANNLVGVDNTGFLKLNATNQTSVPTELAGLSSPNLAYNGGPTETISLPLGSYALGRGLAGSTYPTTDERGVVRPGNNQLGDVGAFQFSNPPTVTQNPSSATITVPGTTSTSFTVSASDIYNDGTSLSSDTTSVQTTVQWQISTDGGQTFTNIASGGLYGPTPTSTTLIINGNNSASLATLEALNGVEYRAVFTNPVGQTLITTAATLTVDYAPTITTQPSNQTVVATNTAIFTAAEVSNPTVTSIQWEYSNGGPYAPLSDGTFNGATVSGSSSNTLTITGTTPALNGYSFEVVYTNSVSSTTTSAATLTVDYAPIVTSPTLQTVTVGGATTFTASSNANPAASVQWYVSTNGGSTFSLVSGAIYSGATTNALTITGVTAAMNGYEYEAIFTNSIGSTTTSAAMLSVGFAPIVTTQPISLTVNAASTATFTAAASANPALTGIQWEYSSGGPFATLPNGSFNGATVSGATTNTLTITGTTAALNGYMFNAVYTNPKGTTTTSTATLTVNYAPIVTSPTSQIVVVGGTTSFTASANANPAASVQWLVSTNGGATFSLVSGAIYSGTNTDTLTITGATAAMNGYEYEALFTNSIGSTMTSAATLSVNFDPIIITQPSNLTVNAGNTALFTAATSSNPAVSSTEWLFSNGGSFTPLGNGPFNGATVSGATTNTLTIAGATAALNGYQFEVMFSNGGGSTTSSAATLTVGYAPIVTSPSNQTVTAGATNVTFTASATANPSAGVQWYVSTNNGSTFSLISGSGYSGATTNTLTIVGPVTAATNGSEYEAIYTNSIGSATSTPATLTVNYAPVITSQPSPVTVNAGTTATFTAAATSNPAVTGIQWLVSSGGSFSILSNGSFNGATVSGAATNTLTITGATSMLNGYQFEARYTNSVGSSTTLPATLTVDSAPTLTINGNPTSESVLLGNNASFTASATGNPIPSIQWDVSTDGGNTFTPVSAGGVYGSNVSSGTLNITNPPASMNGYKYEAIFTNGVSPPAVSSAATLTVGTLPTLTTGPTSTIINIGGNTSFTAAGSGFPAPTVQWEVNKNNGGGFTAIGNGGVYSGATTNTLTITGVTAAMNGYQYEAVFTNVFGSVATSAATLSDLGFVLTAGPKVLLYSTSGTLAATLTPFGNSVTSVQAAVGNLTGGVNSNLVVATGPGGGVLEVLNGLTGSVAETITPYGLSYNSGLNFALGNVLDTNTSHQDIVIAPAAGGKGIAVYNNSGTYITGFIPFGTQFPNKSYTGGLHVAVGKLTGSSKETIVLGTAAPQAAFVGQWNYTGGNTFAQGPIFNYGGHGMYVGTVALTPGGPADLVVGTQNLGTSALIVQNPANGSWIAHLPLVGTSIFSNNVNTGEVRVGVSDVNGDGIPDIVVATGAGATQELRVFDLDGGFLSLVETLSAAQLNLTAGYNGGLYVG